MEPEARAERLGRIASIQTGPFGSQLHASDYEATGTPIITVEHLGDNAVVHENLPLVGAADRRRLEKYTLQTGDVVFTRVGAIDRRAYVSPHEDGWLFSGRLLRVRPNPAMADGRFLSHLLGLHQTVQWIRNHAVGSTMACLNTAILSAVPLTLPGLPEQRRIAEILDTLDEAIRKTEQLIAKLKQVKQGLLHDLLTRGIDDNGELRDPARHPEQFIDSPVGRIPVAWNVRLVDEVARRGSGHTPSKSVPAYWNGGINWVSLADSNRLDQIYIFDTDKEISDLGIANSSAVKHRPGTVIVSRDAGVGKSAILGLEMAVSQHFIAWTCTPLLNEVFLYYWLQHNKPRFEAIAFGSTIKTIGLPFFKRLRMIVPPRAEQDAASARLLAIEARASAETKQAKKLRLLKNGLMENLLTGRVRVTNLESEAAA